MAVETIWKINGLELELDMSDYDTAVKYNEALNLMQTETKTLSEDGTPETIKEYASLFHRCFDRIFGEGTSKKMFDGKYNSRLCDNAMDDLIEFVTKQKSDLEELQKERLNKYRPNRATRRTKK